MEKKQNKNTENSLIYHQAIFFIGILIHFIRSLKYKINFSGAISLIVLTVDLNLLL